ncbi:GNAT family N-acetyltransferase [Streptomyces sp. 549]|uniref:GNAT family N-acetyltransferase n=1 Tax=Streptomyces sp. 549 TaxID=3049076 RepID=UPI0024C3E376|nr:GNAT family N-acetyltransferase [Streptomyces sp. 549]MDK1476782.1 GNAT family N-acetyltransferase [Streptomyces sp. 549]
MDVPAKHSPVTLHPATGQHARRTVENLAQLYRHDLSEFTGQLPAADGTFRFGPLPSFFDAPDRRAYLIRAADQLAGFALTRRMDERVGPDGDQRTSLSAFFVVRALRGHGVGRRAALYLLSGRPGPWGIAYQEANPGAARFWRQVAADAAGTAWHAERRPSPSGAAGAAPDVWLLLDTANRHREATCPPGEQSAGTTATP